jgi:hypothetical protein
MIGTRQVRAMAGEKFSDRNLNKAGGGDVTFYRQNLGTPDEIGIDVDQELTFLRRPL